MILLLPFMTVVLLIVLTPGPDIALLTRNALRGGRRYAFFTSFGITSGVLVWALASAVGLSALLAQSADAYTVVKIGGAAFLVYLGFRTLYFVRHGDKSLPGIPENRFSIVGRFNSPYLQGVLNNVLNPKMGVLFISLIPQFITGGSNIAVDSVFLALVFDFTGLCWLIFLSFSISAGKSFLTIPKFRKILDALTGSVLVGLGLAVASERML